METDPLLATLVKVANNASAPLPVTLMVGGTVVSGDVIPLQHYLDRLSKSLGGIYDGATVPPYASSQEVEYLHLQNVTVFASGAAPVHFSEVWRCRLGDVSAFMLLRAELRH